MAKAIETNNLSVTIKETTLLSNISVSIDSGQILAIVGPNGAGKTTFLKALTGELNISAGEFHLCGQTYHTQWPDRAKAVGVLPQLSTLNFPYIVEEVVALGRIPHSSGRQADQTIVQQAMSFMDLEHLAKRCYTSLSGGEKQRTQLARVLAQIWRKEDAEQRLLLLDEPASALDLGHQQLLMDTIKKFASDGVAVVMVVHDINLAAKYADNTLALMNGRCLAQGPTNEIINAALLRQLFNAEIHVVTHPVTHKPYIVL